MLDTQAPQLAASYGADPAPLLRMEDLCAGKLTAIDAQLEASKILAAGGDGRWAMLEALALWFQQRYGEALEALVQPSAIEACASIADYHNICGMVARQLPGQEARALQAYRRALELEPDRSDTLYNLGNLLKQDQPEEAEQCYRRSLTINACAAACWHNLGIALCSQNRHQEALAPLRTSLRLDPAEADVWCNLGLAFYGLEQFEKAERCFRFTIGLDANHAPSHLNLGNALISVLQPEQAIHFLERGVELDSSSTNSLWNLALAYLLLGRFQEGWKYYEARFNGKDFEKVQIPTSGLQIRQFEQLPLAGDPPVVVWSEQGLGDSIQFCRYLNLLEASGVPYLFLARRQMLKLFKDWTGLGERVLPLGSTDPATDQRPHLALMSLPMLYNTELHSVPAQVPYLRANDPTPDHLRVPPPPGGLAVGLVWASNPDNKAMYKNKSLPADLLLPRLLELADLDLIDLHSLQFGIDAEQLSPWLGHPRLTDWRDRLSDFSDTAHVLQQLDLIISVDTAVAHLAGALNRPIWLLLPQNADFRWLKGRSHSPWYPSMRLFRQTAHGDWFSVVEQLKAALDEMLLLDVGALVAESRGSRL
ncbi:tetratricopeptide repeat protein [Cyanobium sp. WAJ14-Wanaka]|uniref:tetratricopeptide repeat protein n=1 Tax=Cyanobium sp. WAJ14-Wanaka TaxID=2823725 RepID=UPI0020CD7915|nr:tetratricopeptide repeat-containing glycosyltransferase family protein [Cyanobium sp. WAJ14-Wanaka]MCP9775647.1 glycosyltransferase family protein [Cyanobium sp. WAJ14-Wanaka]